MRNGYSTKEINGRVYELRPTKFDSHDIGLVPVVVINSLEDIGDLLSTNAMSEADIVATFRAGLAVDVQAKARQAMDKGKKGPTKIEADGIFRKLCAEQHEAVTAATTVGFSAITKLINDYWVEHNTDGTPVTEADPNKVWMNLAFSAPRTPDYDQNESSAR